MKNIPFFVMSVGVNQSIGESHDVTRRTNTVILSRNVCTSSTSGYRILDTKEVHFVVYWHTYQIS